MLRSPLARFVLKLVCTSAGGQPSFVAAGRSTESINAVNGFPVSSRNTRNSLADMKANIGALVRPIQCSRVGENDVLVLHGHQRGIPPSSRAGHSRQFQEPNSLKPPIPVDTIGFHNAPLNAVSFSATICKYSYVSPQPRQPDIGVKGIWRVHRSVRWSNRPSVHRTR
jgi:hypothetical protein